MGIDPLVDEGEPRYEYAGADPVDGIDPNGDEDLVEYRPLIPGRLPVSFPFDFPGWCETASGDALGSYLPGCSAPGGNNPGGPAPPPGSPNNPTGPPTPSSHWTVKVAWRSLLKGEFPKRGPIHIYPLGLWHHTYIEIDEPNGTQDTWGVLGDPPNSGNNQEVRFDDDRNSPAGWSGSRKIASSDADAMTLKFMLDLTVYPGSVCPSCGPNYHNYPLRLDGYNSNTYTFNMIKNWGKTPPEGPALRFFSPGYHFSRGYAGYP